VGVIGIVVFLAGSHLLWQARRDVLYWLEEFFRILRAEFTARGRGDSGAAAKPAKRNKGTLRLVGGFALMILGQVLLLLDLAF
jgi:hypothetical protein